MRKFLANSRLLKHILPEALESTNLHTFRVYCTMPRRYKATVDLWSSGKGKGDRTPYSGFVVNIDWPGEPEVLKAILSLRLPMYRISQ
jgi:hypothetical protein